MRQFAKVIFKIMGCSVLLFITPTSLWLLLNFQTTIGLGLAVGGLTLTLLVVCLFAAHKLPRRVLTWSCSLLSVSLLALLVVVMASAPSGNPGPNSPVMHRFTKPVPFPRYSIANIVPEVEQTNLGFLVASFLDPIFTREQARRLTRDSSAIYAEMERDKDFHELGSVMGWSYAELLGLPFEKGHYYLYVPRQKRPGPMPAILFLHGSVGNFKSYLWLWAKLAEKEGVVIVSPSGGFGNWRTEQTASALKALDDAATVVSLDTNRVYLAGLSNGGLGVCRLAASSPGRFCGLILISPVFDESAIVSTPFLNYWRGRNALILTGAVDDRIPLKYVEQNAASLKSNGVKVAMTVYPEENHFLFFSKSDGVLNQISNWMKQQ